MTKSIALWIKEYSHPLRVIGGGLFLLALVFGVIWIAGKDVEPVAFVLSLLSSLCFASPSIANYVLPDRKPIRHMSFTEIMEFIPTTDPVNDWHGVSMQWASERFLIEDPRLRFRSSIDDVDIQCDDFIEEWANRHPDPKARGYFYNLTYDGALIQRFILVSVDGARADIPPPNWETNKITKLDYAVAKIHDSLGMLDEYIQRSGLSVE